MAQTWDERVERHRARLRARGGNPLAAAISAELEPPVGCAGLWYDDVAYSMPPSARHVARQLARLCGDDTQAAIPDGSLIDAVGRADSAGRTTAYMEGGRALLEARGWLRREVAGRGRGSRTTYFLMPGDPPGLEVAWLAGGLMPRGRG